jgi:hypothetical protein
MIFSGRDLIHFLGWGDEQLEGWRIMLEKNVGSFFRQRIQALTFVSAQEGQDSAKTRICGQPEQDNRA